jgi:hypothetical protein
MRDFIADVNANPVARDAFEALATITIEAISGKRRTIPPDAERCLEDAPPGSVWLTDCPENQMGMSIVEECHERFPPETAELMSLSFYYRWMAFREVRINGVIDEFIRRTEKTVKIHFAALYAAAEYPLTAEGKFDDGYVRRIREIIENEGMGEEP